MKSALWMILLLSAAWNGCAGTGNLPAEVPRGDRRPVRIAVLPFANNCRSDAAADLMGPRLRDGLAAAGLTVVSGDSLRPVLRLHRIRSRGMIGRADAGLLAADLDLDFLLTGSWDVYGERPAPELGLSARVLDPATGVLVRAISLGRTGEDGVGWLGLGRVDSLDALGNGLIDRVLQALLPLPKPGSPPAPALRVAVVTLDNLSGTEYAGAACSGILLASLTKAGYRALEPGFVRELQMARETAFRGGVDRENLLALGSTDSVQVVVTGTVDVFERAGGNQETSVPRAALGLRALDARTGRLILSRELARAGDDHDGLFEQGRIHGLTALVTAVCDDFVKDLQETLPPQEPGRTP